MNYNKKQKLFVRIVAIVCAVLIAGSVVLSAVVYQ
jgi:hypothetical protein